MNTDNKARLIKTLMNSTHHSETYCRSLADRIEAAGLLAGSVGGPSVEEAWKAFSNCPENIHALCAEEYDMTAGIEAVLKLMTHAPMPDIRGLLRVAINKLKAHNTYTNRENEQALHSMEVWRIENELEAIHAHLAAQQPPRVELAGVTDFLRQIVAVTPEGKDLWIQTVKIRAAQYLSDLEKLIALPQTEKGEGWISVSDRLPKDTGRVFCYSPINGRFVGFHVAEEGWCSDESTYVAVTHWQPLPSPPQDAGKVKP